MSKRRNDADVPKLTDLYVSAEDAAKRLGVSIASFYSYVSRRGIRSEPVFGTKRRVYWLPDVERLRPTDGAAADGDVSASEPYGVRTTITLNTDVGHFYRGSSAIELSRTATVEEVASLLWQISPDSLFSDVPLPTLANWSRMKSGISHLSASDRAAIHFILLEQNDIGAFDLSRTTFARTAIRVVREFAAEIVSAKYAAKEPLHAFIAKSLGASAAWGDVVRRLLVLSADHGVTPSAWAVRVLASAGVTPYRVAIAGMAASNGRGLPYSQLNGLSRLLDEMMRAKDPTSVLFARIKEGEEPPGFGSGIYPNGQDPRSSELIDVLRANFNDDPNVRKFLKLKDVIEADLGKSPDFALVSVFICRALGLQPEDCILARVGRMIGWMAHALEAAEQTTLGPAKQFYAGVLPTPPFK